MKVLHILKSEPDEITKILMEPLSETNHNQRFLMYEGATDYDKLVKLVFESDKVICWW
jgi:hypothetical protein